MAGKSYATRLWVQTQRELGTHAHLVERDRTVCLNGQCPDLPTTTTEENQ